jgi:hypothetical protein
MGASCVDFVFCSLLFPRDGHKRRRVENPLFCMFRAMGTIGVDFEIRRSAFSTLLAPAASISKSIKLKGFPNTAELSVNKTNNAGLKRQTYNQPRQNHNQYKTKR